MPCNVSIITVAQAPTPRPAKAITIVPAKHVNHEYILKSPNPCFLRLNDLIICGKLEEKNNAVARFSRISAGIPRILAKVNHLLLRFWNFEVAVFPR